ncbi:MAG: hypothetical protein K6D59_08640 [Bacteroidales bacterium]|nr:hypothetical protein [Bacteroidales bacterium]
MSTTITNDNLSNIIKELMPSDYNSIILDTTIPVKEYKYYFISAFTQHVEYRSRHLDISLGDEMYQRYTTILDECGDKEFATIEKSFVEEMKAAPKWSSEGLLSSARKRMSELINGGRNVDHNKITLNEDEGFLSKEQPTYIVIKESFCSPCSNCNGRGTVEHEDKQGIPHQESCPVCNGYGHTGRLSFFTPTIHEKNCAFVRCVEGEIEGMDFVVNGDTLNIKSTEYSVTNGPKKRMLTRYNGKEEDNYDEALKPYIETIRDKTSENNAVEEIAYTVIPCYRFAYRSILTNELHNGIIIDPENNAALILNVDGESRIMSSVKDSIKKISRFFGNISKSEGFKDKEDLWHTTRLLIAVAVADGTVNDEEKRNLTVAIRGIEQFTSEQQDSLVRLLGEKDASFLNDDDFVFHSRENAEETAIRMQELSQADGFVHITEQKIIERLKFKY